VGSKRRTTPEKQTLILWALLAREGAAGFQKELKPEPDKADRDALAQAGLVRWTKRGQKIWIEVTEKGWAWAGNNLAQPLPANSSAGGLILHAWLTRLKAFMDSRGLVLADVLRPQRSALLKAAPPLSSETTADYDSLRARIRQAYLELADGRYNTPVPLSDLRDKLKDIEQPELDGALARMHLEEGTTLSGLNNPQEITPALRQAALNFKGEPMYILWITK
jgi:hypothetical protein